MQVKVIPTFYLFIVTLSCVASFCRRDEVYKICPGCPATCQHKEPYVCFLPCVAKCVCRPGLLRDETTRKCVKPDDCPNRPKPSPTTPEIETTTEGNYNATEVDSSSSSSSSN